MRRNITLIIVGLIVLGFVSYKLIFHDTYSSETYYASDSGSTVFSEQLKKGEKIYFYFDVKILDGTKSHIAIYGPNGI